MISKEFRSGLKVLAIT